MTKWLEVKDTLPPWAWGVNQAEGELEWIALSMIPPAVGSPANPPEAALHATSVMLRGLVESGGEAIVPFTVFPANMRPSDPRQIVCTDNRFPLPLEIATNGDFYPLSEPDSGTVMLCGAFAL